LLAGILEAATGQNVLDYADMHLFSKIGMNADWWTDELGHAMTYCCIDTTTRDFARFGLLYARNGRWGEDQIVSEAWVKESTTVPTGTDNQNYALQWWVNSSAGYFSSQGLNKNNIYIFPELDLVIVRNSLYTKVGSSSIRTGDNYHATLEPLDWSDSEFLSYITDAINN
jgi:CubicO group peptidase (beta-lactamase class C family)